MWFTYDCDAHRSQQGGAYGSHLPRYLDQGGEGYRQNEMGERQGGGGSPFSAPFCKTTGGESRGGRYPDVIITRQLDVGYNVPNFALENP